MSVSTRSRRIWAWVAAGVGVAAVLTPFAFAQADEVRPMTACGDASDADVPGGTAYWEANCKGNRINVTGWVKDVRSDGKCARVKVHLDGKWHYSKRACPSGEVRRFTFKDSGRDASVYLITS